MALLVACGPELEYGDTGWCRIEDDGLVGFFRSRG
jgi:hypothetical protein